MKKHYIIDFDSTFVQVEALDELAKISLRQTTEAETVIEQIKKITSLGMEGKITFNESLSRRLCLLQANAQHLQELKKVLVCSITPSVWENRAFFKKHAADIYLISGGFKELIWPIVKAFGLFESHIFANQFVFDDKGKIIGAEENNLLAQSGGKNQQLQKLGLTGKIFVLGDGFSDYEMRASGLAHVFVAFVENVRREKVVAVADRVAENFNQFINYTYE